MTTTTTNTTNNPHGIAWADHEAARHRATRYLDRLTQDAANITGAHLVDVLAQPRRHKEAVRARWIIAYVLREAGLSLPGIGWAMGGMDHTTILHALRRIMDDAGLFAQADALAYRYHMNGDL